MSRRTGSAAFSPRSPAACHAKEVRDLCVFSPHNVLRDPPFSRIDLISCRNLLIYFGADAQRQLLPIFHYALRPGGFLFLGKSETIGRFSELFSVVDKKNCIYQARETGAPVRMPPFINGFHPAPFTRHLPENAMAFGRGAIAPDRRGPHRRKVRAAACGRQRGRRHRPLFLADGKISRSAFGAPTRQLLTLARKELRLDLRGALRAAIETRQPVTREAIAFETSDYTVEKVS